MVKLYIIILFHDYMHVYNNYITYNILGLYLSRDQTNILYLIRSLNIWKLIEIYSCIPSIQ